MTRSHQRKHQVELFMPHPVERVTKPLILIHRNINIDRIMVLHPLSICVREEGEEKKKCGSL